MSTQCGNIPDRPGDPRYISFLNPNYSWPVNHPVVSDQGSHTFLKRYAKHNREGGRKEQPNKHGLGSAPSGRRGKSMWHFCAALRAFAGYCGWIIVRNFHKATKNADSSPDCLLALVNLASVGQQILAVVFLILVDSLLCLASIFSQPPSADCVLLWTAFSSQLFCLPLSTGSLCLLCELPSLLHFQSRRRSRPQALCVGFAPKHGKGFSNQRQHKRKWMLPIVSHQARSDTPLFS